MGKINNVFTHYFRNRARFADLFNGICFQGRSVIQPEQLTDASEVYEETEAEKVQPVPQGVKTKRGNRPERIRDIKMRLDTGEVLRFLGQENQALVDYTMPFRCMQYDTMEYAHQLDHLRSQNNAEGNWNSWAERVCGFKQTDRLIPIYTLCVYHGLEKWDGPRSLKDMMNFGKDEDEMSRLFHDYPLHLYCLNEMDDFQVFHTEVRQVFQALRFREDKQKLSKLINTDPAYQHMEADTMEVMSVMLNAPKILENKREYMTIEEGREEYDMCKALKDLTDDARREGVAKGMAQGMESGIIQGTLSTLISLVQKGLLQIPDAAEQAGLTEDDFRQKMVEFQP